MGKYLGLILLALSNLVTLPLLWDALAPPIITADKFFSVFCSANAFVGMAIMMLLAARFSIIERLAGGLDKLYVSHRYLGILIAALLLVHYFIKPTMEGLYLSKAWDEYAHLSAKISFFALAGVIVISLLKKSKYIPFEIPYGLWRSLHRLTGGFFFLAAIHIVFIEKTREMDIFHPFVQWMIIVSIFGLACYLYAELFPKLNRVKYVVEDKVLHKEATAITLIPVSKSLKSVAGQFAFLKFYQKGLTESHPFTIAKQHADGRLTFMIKPLGDFTRSLRENLDVGTKVRVEGGWGRFNYKTGGADQIWVAGGIGITPFIAWAALFEKNDGKKVHLFYSVRNLVDALNLEEFERLASTNTNFKFTLIETVENGRLNAQKIEELYQENIVQSDFYFCGPKIMRTSILSGLKRKNLIPKKVHFEQFQFR